MNGVEVPHWGNIAENLIEEGGVGRGSVRSFRIEGRWRGLGYQLAFRENSGGL